MTTIVERSSSTVLHYRRTAGLDRFSELDHRSVNQTTSAAWGAASWLAERCVRHFEAVEDNSSTLISTLP